jgi:hypothetical protein
MKKYISQLVPLLFNRISKVAIDFKNKDGGKIWGRPPVEKEELSGIENGG